MRAIVVILAAAPALGACTPMQWVKDDSTAGQLKEDLNRCEQDAWREARMSNWYYPPYGSISGRPFAGRPLQWPAGPYFSDPYMEEARLTQFCMRNKGYELKPADEDK